MAFQNEYIPPVEQETSEFFKKARETLRTGFSKFDRWTIDRAREMVLFRCGGGHSLEAMGEDYWSFLDANGEYSCDTKLVEATEVTADEIAIRRTIGFRDGSRNAPDAETLGFIKEALQEYKDWGLKSDYKRCQLTLIDAATGKEI